MATIRFDHRTQRRQWSHRLLGAAIVMVTKTLQSGEPSEKSSTAAQPAHAMPSYDGASAAFGGGDSHA